MEYVIAYLVGVIVWGIVWGIVARAIVLNKGYYHESTKWFWLGFFFALIAVIVAATKPVIQSPTIADAATKPSSQPPARIRYTRTSEDEQRLLKNGGWRCDCGRVNEEYVWTCVCGKSKSGMNRRKIPTSDGADKATVTEQQRTAEISKAEAAPKSQAAAIREYKALLDEGIITQEEFDAKKKQLLGL